MDRSLGERLRLKRSIARLRTTIENVELSLTLPGPLLETGAALMTTATEVALQLAKLDAYELAEQDQRP